MITIPLGEHLIKIHTDGGGLKPWVMRVVSNDKTELCETQEEAFEKALEYVGKLAFSADKALVKLIDNKRKEPTMKVVVRGRWKDNIRFAELTVENRIYELDLRNEASLFTSLEQVLSVIVEDARCNNQ